MRTMKAGKIAALFVIVILGLIGVYASLVDRVNGETDNIEKGEIHKSFNVVLDIDNEYIENENDFSVIIEHLSNRGITKDVFELGAGGRMNVDLTLTSGFKIYTKYGILSGFVRKR